MFNSLNINVLLVELRLLLIEPALSADDNTLPTVATTTVSGYLIDGEYLYDAEGTWDPYGCNEVTGVPDNGVCSPVLDVELSNFNVTAKKESVILDWTTLSEINSDKFIIERSHDGKSFTSIGEVVSKGNSNYEVDYEYFDVQPLDGISYYRLQELSLDGNSTYSKIVSVDYTSYANIVVYPNPASNQLFWNNVNENLNYKLMIMHGQEVSSGFVNKSNEALDLSTISGGIHFIKIYNQNNELTQIIKVFIN